LVEGALTDSWLTGAIARLELGFERTGIPLSPKML
jgi:hypothetical protein